MSVHHIVPIPAGEFCDFCTETPIFTLYRCTNFAVEGHPVFEASRSLGVWAVCRECADFVDAERWSALSERASRKFVERHCVPRHQIPLVWSQFTEIVRLFAAHRLKISM